MEAGFWRFVDEEAGADSAKLRLKYHGFGGGFDYGFAITQIECRKKFKKKLCRTLAENQHFLFPSVLAGEQATSDLFAAFHMSLIDNGLKVVDLTAGLGIDASHLAEGASRMVAVERDAAKAECLELNFGEKMEVVCADCRDYLESCDDDAFNVVFIDPARRTADGSRVFALADCEPNIVDMLPLIRCKARMLVVKVSPMLDVTSLMRDLPGCTHVLSVGSSTECRELVVIADLRSEAIPVGRVIIEAVTLADGKNPVAMDFTREEEAAAQPLAAEPAVGHYLLEPYPSVMKAAPFNLLCQRYGVGKIHPNTQLFFGENAPADFPGEAFRIEAVIPYESKYIKRLKNQYPTLRVTVRNFDVSAEALRKKLGVRDGGDRRLFAVTSRDKGKLMIIVGPSA